jgi:hypothetical protein
LLASISRAPHSAQNFAVGLDRASQEAQTRPAAVSPPQPSPLGSTSISFHYWSTKFVLSPSHVRHEVLRLSLLVHFETGSLRV